MTARSQTASEISEAPEKIEMFLKSHGRETAELGRELARRSPALFMTNARGTSDNGATFFKYACEILAGIPVASIGPSVASIYKTRLSIKEGVCLSISQSGQSPDLITAQAAVRQAGAQTIAFVNATDSPLADGAKHVIPLLAGKEVGIAATKSFICTLTALSALLCGLSNDEHLWGALTALPERLRDAGRIDWDSAIGTLADSRSLYVTARGPMLGIAQEAALKLKEMTGLHAEALSAAELMHGPVRLVRPGFPVLAFLSVDQSQPGTIGVLGQLVKGGARVMATDQASTGSIPLPVVRTGHPLTDAIASMQTFYVFAEKLTKAMGHDPDALPGLQKITMTT